MAKMRLTSRSSASKAQILLTEKTMVVILIYLGNA
jgi:hypothetical protein